MDNHNKTTKTINKKNNKFVKEKKKKYKNSKYNKEIIIYSKKLKYP